MATIVQIASSTRPAQERSVIETQSGPKKIVWRKGKMIGDGAHGKVFVGFDAVSGRMLAAKEFSFDGVPNFEPKIAMLANEIRIMKELKHEHIVKYIGADKKGTTFYIFMEYVPGGSVRSILDEFGAFPEDVARKYTYQMLLGLSYLHDHNVVHRDVKGANVLVSVNGRVRLSDFGSAHYFDTEEDKEMRGTAYWLAPEVIRGEKATSAADIWSLGCTLLEMLTGDVPFGHMGNSVAVMVANGDPHSTVDIPETVDLSFAARDFLMACFNKVPHCRPTATELLQMPFITEFIAVDDMVVQSVGSTDIDTREARNSSSLPTISSVKTGGTSGMHSLSSEAASAMISPLQRIKSTNTTNSSSSGERTNGTNTVNTELNSVSVGTNTNVFNTVSSRQTAPSLMSTVQSETGEEIQMAQLVHSKHRSTTSSVSSSMTKSKENVLSSIASGGPAASGAELSAHIPSPERDVSPFFHNTFSTVSVGSWARPGTAGSRMSAHSVLSEAQQQSLVNRAMNHASRDTSRSTQPPGFSTSSDVANPLEVQLPSSAMVPHDLEEDVLRHLEEQSRTDSEQNGCVIEFEGFDAGGARGQDMAASENSGVVQGAVVGGANGAGGEGGDGQSPSEPTTHNERRSPMPTSLLTCVLILVLLAVIAILLVFTLI